MAVKFVKLKSGEELVADVKEVFKQKGDDRPLAYMLKDACILGVEQESQPELLNEDGTEDAIVARLVLRKWIVFTDDNEQVVPLDWVVTFANPSQDVINVYEKRMEVDRAEQVNTTGEDTDADSGSTIQE